MNILFVYPTLFHPMRGGVERVTDILTKEFIRRGHNILYLHNKRDESLMDYDYPAPVYFFPKSDYHDNLNIPFYHNFLHNNSIDIVINQCGMFHDSTLYLNVLQHTKSISVLHSNPLLNYNYLSSDILRLKNTSFMEHLKLVGRFLLYPSIKRDILDSRKQQINYLAKHTDIICLLSEGYRNP